ncbi:uncharacterized protein LOC135833967 [Planococcus citri]|uniref:uncharacterized protein LOC135833967 n=1 Tax=Planococcus citri TaxID=170843 RepID=UPI0031F769CC
MILIQSIIIFIGFCQFSFSNADKLPEDNGRIELAQCLGNFLSWETNNFEGTEEHLFEFCNGTALKKKYIQKQLEGKKLTPEGGMKTIRSCLGDRGEELITRYKTAFLHIIGTKETEEMSELAENQNSSPIDTIEPLGIQKLPEYTNSSPVGNTKEPEEVPKLPENENPPSHIVLKKLEGTPKLSENKSSSPISNTKEPEGTQKFPENKSSSPIPPKEPQGTPKLPENENSSPFGSEESEESEETSELPEFNEMVLGLCRTPEFVEFDKLSDEEKPKSIVCLRKCAAGLFVKFVAMYKIFKDNYDEMLKSNKIKPLMQIDIPKQTDADTDAIDEPKKLDLTKISPRKFELRKTVIGYVNECKNKIKKDKSLLNILGAQYAKTFIVDIDKLYEVCPYKEEKGKLFLSIQSYFACVRWTCSMKKEKDIPFRNLLEKVIGRISEDDNDLVKDFSTESIQETNEQ